MSSDNLKQRFCSSNHLCTLSLPEDVKHSFFSLSLSFCASTVLMCVRMCSKLRLYWKRRLWRWQTNDNWQAPLKSHLELPVFIDASKLHHKLLSQKTLNSFYNIVLELMVYRWFNWGDNKTALEMCMDVHMQKSGARLPVTTQAKFSSSLTCADARFRRDASLQQYFHDINYYFPISRGG